MSIGSTLSNLPIVSHISSFFGRASRVIQKDEEAANEAQVTAMVVGSGAVFGLFGRCTVMASEGEFSSKSLLFWGIIGATAGTVASAYTIYSFMSNMKKREEK